jgi:DNA-binding NarL/FixJ family response regulator
MDAMVNDGAGASGRTGAGGGTGPADSTADGTAPAEQAADEAAPAERAADGAGAARVRVLLVDDEALMRSGLRLMLDGARGIEVVGEACDGLDALEQITALAPEVVLLDVRMPRMTGLEALAALRERGETARVVMLTAFDTDEFLLEALRAGAAGFLLKDSPPEEVVEAVLDAAADRPRFSPEVLRRLVRLAADGGEAVLPAAGQGTAGSGPAPSGAGPSAASSSAAAPPADASSRTGGPPAESPPAEEPPAPAPEGITEREWDVAHLVAKGLANQEIGESLFMSVATVKTHLGRLYQKLQVTNRVQLAIRVLELGG